MKRNENACCGNCPFWAPILNHQSAYAKERGECRKNSPYDASGNGDTPVNSWDWTKPDSWCGEHPDFDTDRLKPLTDEVQKYIHFLVDERLKEMTTAETDLWGIKHE